jgi:hypothetical protein
MMKSDEQILSELKRAAEGLFYMSESDYLLEPVRLEAAAEPDSEWLRELAGVGADARVETMSLEEFFHDAAAVRMPREGTGESPRAASFQNVVRTLGENLTDIKVYRIGEINIPIYVLGRSGSGNWLGLSTRVVET